MQKDVGYIMEWFDTHREMYRSSGTSTEEVEPDEELSKSWMNPNGLKLN